VKWSKTLKLRKGCLSFTSPIGGAKFATLRLFIETMPIYKAVASRNGNKEFYKETTGSNLKSPSIGTMPD
jgi:hypothetical protein